MGSINNIRKNIFTKWMVVFIVFLFLEAGTVELIIFGTTDISLEQIESSSESDTFEKDLEKELETDEISTSFHDPYDQQISSNSLYYKRLKTNTKFGEVISPPPESNS